MFKKLLLIGIIVCGIGACGLEKYPGGDLPTNARLNAVKIGDTKEKVLTILGSPASESLKTDNGKSFIIYAENLKESRAFLKPQEINRDVYVYTFDGNNILTDKKHLTLADGKSVPFETAKTAVSGKDLSVLEQLVDNFGKYNAGGHDSSVRR